MRMKELIWTTLRLTSKISWRVKATEESPVSSCYIHLLARITRPRKKRRSLRRCSQLLRLRLMRILKIVLHRRRKRRLIWREKKLNSLMLVQRMGFSNYLGSKWGYLILIMILNMISLLVGRYSILEIPHLRRFITSVNMLLSLAGWKKRFRFYVLYILKGFLLKVAF